MALTFSEKLRGSMGGKAWRAFEVTHDGSTTAMSASSFDLDRIEFATFSLGTLASAPAATVTMTVAASGLTTDLSEALKATSITQHTVIGY